MKRHKRTVHAPVRVWPPVSLTSWLPVRKDDECWICYQPRDDHAPRCPGAIPAGPSITEFRIVAPWRDSPIGVAVTADIHPVQRRGLF
jgi:hypothetical protein